LDGEQDEVTISHAELDRRARAIGAWLLEQVAAPGRPVLLLFPPGLEFIAAYFGCLYGGMVTVPAYPAHPARRTRAASRLEGIIENASPRMLPPRPF
jgi:acyl-CoA synthetase (AMP-forming)/AMP-acid ligase II